MDYELSSRERAWRDEVREFIAEHVDDALADETRQRGNEGRGPRAQAFLQALKDRGWWGLAWPPTPVPPGRFQTPCTAAGRLALP